MRTYRTRHLLTLLVAALTTAALLTAIAPDAVAATPAPVTSLHPDGTGSEQFVVSPVTFSAVRADPDRDGRTAYVVQRRTDSGWGPAATRTSAAPVQIALGDGAIRWRARSEVDGVAGPWSSWIELTVDSRKPATPVVDHPDSGTVGHTLTVTASSPDGLAVAYYLSRFGNRLVVPDGQDPCLVEGYACPATPGGPVTFPITVMSSTFLPLSVYALGRNGIWSDASPQRSVLFRVDDVALTDATRWPVQDLDGTTVPDVHGGPGLLVAPNAVVVAQRLMSEFDQSTVAVPSLRFVRSTTARTDGVVVDTASTFTVGAVVHRPGTTPPGDVTVLSQAADTGLAFSLVLTRTLSWRFCVTTVDATVTCTGAPAFRRGDADSVVASWSPVLHRIAVAGSSYAPFTTTAVPGDAPIRAAAGPLVFGGTAVPRTGPYVGQVGSPFVARGVISAGQVRGLFGVD